jgi:hypothetical protein
MAMDMSMAGKQKNEIWRELRHKGGCCCFGWAVYAPWACYMNLRALYVSKLEKCPLICPDDLVGDQTQNPEASVICYFLFTTPTSTLS